MSNKEVDSHYKLLQLEKRVTEHLKILFMISKCRIQDKDLLCQPSVILVISFQYKAVRNDRKLVSTYVMHSAITSTIRLQNEEHLYEKCRYVVHFISKELECKGQDHGSEEVYLIPFFWSISNVLRDHLCDEQDAMFLTN